MKSFIWTIVLFVLAFSVAAENRTYSILPIDSDIPIELEIQTKVSIPQEIKVYSIEVENIKPGNITIISSYNQSLGITGNLSFLNKVNINLTINESQDMDILPMSPKLPVKAGIEKATARESSSARAIASNSSAVKPIKSEPVPRKSVVGNFVNFLKKIPSFIKNILGK